jgi:hypothetical protein
MPLNGTYGGQGKAVVVTPSAALLSVADRPGRPEAGAAYDQALVEDRRQGRIATLEPRL